MYEAILRQEQELLELHHWVMGLGIMRTLKEAQLNLATSNGLRKVTPQMTPGRANYSKLFS